MRVNEASGDRRRSLACPQKQTASALGPAIRTGPRRFSIGRADCPTGRSRMTTANVIRSIAPGLEAARYCYINSNLGNRQALPARSAVPNLSEPRMPWGVIWVQPARPRIIAARRSHGRPKGIQEPLPPQPSPAQQGSKISLGPGPIEARGLKSSHPCGPDQGDKKWLRCDGIN